MYILLLFILPLLAIISIINVDKINNIKIKNISLIWSILNFLLFLFITIIFNYNNYFQISFIYKWLSYYNFYLYWNNILFSIDGISLVFIGLSSLLIPICIIMSWNINNKFEKEFQICLHIIYLLLLGVFSIFDILWFYILFESILIPMFLIIGIWGSREQKIKASFYFFFYTLIGSLLMLISIFKIYSITGTTNYQSLLIINIPNKIQFWLFLGFFMSLSVKIPMIPFHIWLPQAHVEAPISGSILLAGILLKLGGYGFIRFSYPLFPNASEYFTPFIILLSIIAIIFASFTTLRQIDIKRLIAYSSVSHMGLVTLTIFTHSLEGLIASTLMMLAHGFTSSGLFMTSSIIYYRYHSRILKYFKGLTIIMPIFSSITIILILANISFPLTFNFIAEFFSLAAILNFSYFAGVLTCIGIIIGTTYSLYFYNRIWFGQLSRYLVNTRDLIRLELYGFLPLIILIIYLGIYPNNIIKYFILSSYINISLY